MSSDLAGRFTQARQQSLSTNPFSALLYRRQIGVIVC
jgi:hypothetical protein